MARIKQGPLETIHIKVEPRTIIENPKSEPTKVTRNKKGKLIEASQKQIVYNVVQENIELGNSKTKSVELAAEATGFSSRSIWGILAEKDNTNEFTSPNRKKTRKDMYAKLDEAQLERIRQHIHNMFLSDKPLSIRKILTIVNADESLPQMSRETLRTLMKKLGF